jgi:YHS domain-containing protein
MATVKDPVCGMEVDVDRAAGQTEYQGHTYYFCATACREAFAAAPQAYAGRDLPGGAMANGLAAAAILAAGIGCFALGLLTTLAAASPTLNRLLAFYGPAGPLSGKTTLAVVLWLVGWAILHRRWRDRQVPLARVFVATVILIALALLGTFPPLYEAFGG